jgi:Holliday junction DNA helicase RuvA
VISRLTGNLLELDGAHLVVDIHGVGYEIEVAGSVIETLPQIGVEISLFTHFVVREDAQLLYGFASRAERDLFRAYIKINGVGPKLGLSLISSLDPSTLAQAVRSGDVSVLTKVPGVGKKTAERLLLELKNRLDALSEISGAPLAAIVAEGGRTHRAVEIEAEDALLALGYRPADAARIVGRAMQNLADNATVEEIVRQSLRTLAQQQTKA